MTLYRRLTEPPRQSFFLLGMRGVGKSGRRGRRPPLALSGRRRSGSQRVRFDSADSGTGDW